MDNRFSSWMFNIKNEETYGLVTSLQGRISLCNEVQTINQSILMILGTEPGERVMVPDFGCEINKIIFSPIDDTTLGLAKYYVTTALNKWEKRIELVKINVDISDDNPVMIVIDINYLIKKSNINGSVIFNYNLTGENS